ncbi:TPA: phage tail spike protein [Streptococcus suis]
MLYLLDKDTKTVKWNGIPLHEASSAVVKEETNGDFYLTVNYPITDSGIYQLIKEDMLIKAPVPVLGAQLFRIKKPVENDDSLDITAYHISDDVMQRSIRPVSVVGQGCAMALSQMVQNAKTGLGDFSFASDIMDSRTFNTTETETLYSVLLDGKHSIVGTWEGELVRDNFALTIKRNRGADRGVVITTHKNLKSYQRTKNSQSVVTRIHAKSTFKAEGAETDTVLTVTVDSPLINSYPYINEKEYENNDAKTIDELKKWAEAKFKNEGIDKVSDAIEIEAYELDGQVVHLGDTVNIKSSKHSVDIYKKAIAYEYNALTDEYISITFDDKPGVGGSGVSSGVSNAADVILSANQNAQEVAIERAVKNANKAFDAEFDKRVEVINNGIEQSKAEAELYADTIKQNIDAEIDAVNSSMQAQSEEHDRQVADILSKTQSVESLANQAKTDAASAIARANQVKTEAIADARAQVATVSQALNTAKTDLQNKVNGIDAKAQTLTADLTNSKNDILAQATAQTALKNRVTTVEATANGTKETVTQLSKTVNDLTGEVTSATQSIKTVEDSIDGVYTTLSKIQVGGANLLNRTRGLFYNSNKTNNTSETYQGFTVASGSGYVDIYRQEMNTIADKTDYFLTFYAKGAVSGQTIACFFFNPSSTKRAESNQGTVTTDVDGKVTITLTTTWQRYWIKWTQSAGATAKTVLIGRNYSTDRAYVTMPALFEGNTIRDWASSLQDASMEFAEYKQTIDGQLTSLSTSYQTLNGQVSQNTAKIETTADSIREDLTSIQSYVDDEGVRKTEYLTVSELKTAELIAAERTAVSANYVAKSVYDEDARGTTLKLNEIKTTADTAKQNLATYQETVNRKLTELTTRDQTLDGKITTASTKVDTVAGQIRTEIGTVEAKIPTEIGGRNYILKSQAKLVSAGRWVSKPFNLSNDLLSNLSKIKTVTISCDVEGSNVTYFNNRKRYGVSFSIEIDGIATWWEVWQAEDTAKKRISQTFTVPDGKVITKLFSPELWIQAVGDIKVSNPKIEFGSVPTDHTLAPEDINDELSSVKTTITQTASGVEQLSTSLSTTNGKVTTAETKISQLISDVSSKVSQTEYNTLTGRVSSAETAITQNATEISKRLTSTQVEQAITNKGYATVTALNNKVKETADSFSRTISETRALIPTEVWGVNLFVINGISERLEVISDGGRFVSNVLDFNKTYTVSTNIPLNSYGSADAFAIVDGETPSTPNNGISVGKNRTLTTSSTSKVVYIVFRGKSVFDKVKSGEYRVKIERGTAATDWAPAPEDLATVTALHAVNDTVDSHTRTIGAVGTTGSILDNVSKVTQTANRLVTEVSGANGLKTQVSTLAGSYAIKNLTKAGDVLGQINLNPDGSVRINEGLISVGTKTYIKDGVISSAKIASLDAGKITTGTLDAARIATNSITGSHIEFDQAFFNSFMANEAYLKQIFAKNAFITSVQSVAISASKVIAGVLKATNGALDINLDNASMVFRQDAKIEFQSENNTLFRTRNGTSAFIHFRDDGYNGVYTAMGVNADNTGTQNDYSSGRFAGVRVIRTNPNRYSGETIDQVQLIGDEIRMRHGYGYENDYLVVNYDGGPKINLMAWLRQFNANFMHLVNITGRGDVIKTF